MNPAAGRGRGARVEQTLRQALAGVGVGADAIRTTARAGDEAELTRRALNDGATTIVAVGGDGTWSNVAHALLRSGADCRLGLVAAGTGNDFAKSVGVPARDFAASARLAVDGPDRRVDVGRVEDRWFLNTVGFGFDVAVLEAAARVRWLRGRLLYVYTALRQLFQYRGTAIAWDDGNGSPGATRRLLLVVANGHAFGGAFRIAPNASISDGLLDLVAIPDASSAQRLRLFARAMRGTHIALPSVDVRRAPRFSLRFDSPPVCDVDGELHRAQSSRVSVECVPAALRVVGARY